MHRENNFPQTRSSVYTESGNPVRAALSHILWKWLQLAGAEQAALQPAALRSPENIHLKINRLLGRPGYTASLSLPKSCPPAPGAASVLLLALSMAVTLAAFSGTKEMVKRIPTAL